MSLLEQTISNIEKILSTVKELIDSASFNKSFRATVTEKINNTVYKVSYKNAEYKVKSCYDLLVGDLVWVCAPENDYDSLFVQSYNGFRDRIITTDKVVNNLTTNVAGTVLDGRIGKNLNDKFEQLNSNLVKRKSIELLTFFDASANIRKELYDISADSALKNVNILSVQATYFVPSASNDFIYSLYYNGADKKIYFTSSTTQNYKLIIQVLYV